MTEMWFTADTHFSHAAVMGHGNRPWASVEEMNEGLVEAWNAAVGPRDTVWHLGDVAFLSDLCVAGWLSRLNGRIHLLIGNHDSVKELIPGRDQFLNLEAHSVMRTPATNRLKE